MAPHLESGLTAPAQRTVPPLDILDRLPRLGWAADPTPIQAMPELAAELGLGWLGCKRDDLTQPGSGGTKTRKLDFLLASPPWRDAPGRSPTSSRASRRLSRAFSRIFR